MTIQQHYPSTKKNIQQLSQFSQLGLTQEQLQFCMRLVSHGLFLDSSLIKDSRFNGRNAQQAKIDQNSNRDMGVSMQGQSFYRTQRFAPKPKKANHGEPFLENFDLQHTLVGASFDNGKLLLRLLPAGNQLQGAINGLRDSGSFDSQNQTSRQDPGETLIQSAFQQTQESLNQIREWSQLGDTQRTTVFKHYQDTNPMHIMPQQRTLEVNELRSSNDSVLSPATAMESQTPSMMKRRGYPQQYRISSPVRGHREEQSFKGMRPRFSPLSKKVTKNNMPAPQV